MPANGALDFDRSVRTRRIRLGHEQAMPQYFVDGDLLMSHIMATLSATFPKGEQFFIDSVRNYRDQLDDPELRQQVSGFIGQEVMHGREHDRFNEVLHGMGYPTAFVDDLTGRAMGIMQRLPRPVQLAITAAAEHFTSVLAEQLLEDDGFNNQDIPDDVRALFQWHALEESEHKSVAFDVYRDQVDNEAIRLVTMHALTSILGAVVLVSMVSTVLTDRRARNPIRFLRSLANLRNSPFARKQIALRLLEYNRPRFHPDDRDTEQLVEEWRERLFGAQGSMNTSLSHLERVS